jgi:hypothetical protein
MQHETVSATPRRSTLSSSNWQTLENKMEQTKQLNDALDRGGLDWAGCFRS